MSTVSKINIEFLNSLSEKIKEPNFIVSANGTIVYSNSATRKYFPYQSVKNLSQFISDYSINEIRDITINHKIELSSTTHILPVKLISGESIDCEITFTSLKDEDDEEIFLLTFLTSDKESSTPVKIKLDIEEIEHVIKNENVLKIIKEIKSLYPFTFIGKEKIQTAINKLEIPFWIKNSQGNFILANNKLAKYFGLRNSQLERRSEKDFIPAYMLEIFELLNEHLKKNLSIAAIEGVSLKGASFFDKQQTVYIPISDADNNLLITIGLIQKNREDNTKQKSELTSNNILNELPIPVCLFDENGVIKDYSNEFKNHFNHSELNVNFTGLDTLFSEPVFNKVMNFVNNYQQLQQTDFEDFITQIEGPPLPVKFVIKKNNFHIDSRKTFSLLIQSQSVTNFENPKNLRGRMLEFLLKNSPDPIFIYDAENLRFLEVNNAALQLYGYRREEFLQMDLTDLYSPEDIQTLLDTSSSKSKEGQYTGPWRHKKKDGESVFVEISKFPMNYKDKESNFMMIRDVGSILEIKSKSQLFKAAFDNTNDLIFVTDNIGIIQYFNQSVLNVLEYPKTELEDSSFTTFFKDDERGTINTTIFHSHIKDTVTLISEMKKYDGEIVEVELTATPIFDYNNEPESFTIIGKINKKPEMTVNEVVREVIIEKQVEGQTGLAPDFLKNLFHEILTPINVILGFVQELSESIPELDDDQKEAMNIIKQNRDRLLLTMNSAVEYSHIVQNKIELTNEKVVVTEILDYLNDVIKRFSDYKKVELAYGKISSSLSFISDKSRFENFVELLSKIITLITKENKIYFSAYNYSDDSFILCIKDASSGATNYLIDNFTNLFTSDDISSSKDFGISKLTLHLSKKLLPLLKGKFEVIKKKDDNFELGFIFPLDISHTDYLAPEIIEEEEIEDTSTLSEIITPKEIEITEPVIVEEEIETAVKDDFFVNETPASKIKFDINLSNLSCLYIEDQVDSQILFKVQMKELKDIKFAVSFEDALPLIESNKFDFIVMDINLQGEYNGLDALKLIHNIPEHRNIPIIAVTAYVLPGDREKFIASGFNDFVSKPIFREKMLEVLEKILKN